MSAGSTNGATGDPATFPIDDFIAGIEPAEYEARYYQKPALADRMTELVGLIDRATASGENAPERAMDDGAGVEAWTAEYNQLLTEWKAASLLFKFRPINSYDSTAAREKMRTAGKDPDDDALSGEFMLYQMAETCTHPAGVTAEHFIAMQTRGGDRAMGALTSAWFRAIMSGGEQAVPFSPLSSPIAEPAT